MHFKTVRLTTIRNESKRTISTSGELELLQIVSEPDTGRCANKDTGPPKKMDCKILHRLDKGNETFLIKVFFILKP